MRSSHVGDDKAALQPRHRRPRPRIAWPYAAASVLLLAGVGGTAVVLLSPAKHRTPVGIGTPPNDGSPGPSGSPGPIGAPPVTRAAEAPGPIAPTTPTPTNAPVTCRYEPAPNGSASVRPPNTPARAGTVRATVQTNLGPIVIELAADRAPCTVNSFISLAGGGFYTDSACHRLTTAGIFVLQCGDPTATGAGGPGYRFPDENLPVGIEPPYPRGTLAMANAGPGTNGSQFFMVYRDSTIAPNYTVFGRVVSGLDVVDKVAAAGAPNGDGAPNQELDLLKIEVG